MNHTLCTAFCGVVLAVNAAPGAPKRDTTQTAYDDVGTKVQARSGQFLRWEKDQATRQQNLDEARRLLRRPLTVKTVVRVALLNNLQLQATLEDVGIALADFREAGYLPNPVLVVNPQIPDHAPRTPEWDYGLTFSSDSPSACWTDFSSRCAKG
jgi:hypothetical protein